MLSTHHKDFCSLSHDFHSLNLNRLQHLQVFGDRTPRNERTNPSVDANGAFLLGRELLRQRQQQTSPWSPSHGRPPHIFIEEGGATATFFAHQRGPIQHRCKTRSKVLASCRDSLANDRTSTSENIGNKTNRKPCLTENRGLCSLCFTARPNLLNWHAGTNLYPDSTIFNHLRFKFGQASAGHFGMQRHLASSLGMRNPLHLRLHR